MANRTVVRQGPVVIVSLTSVLLIASLGLGSDGSSAPAAKDKDKPAVAAPAVAPATTTKAPVIPPELKPYKIKAWLSVDPLARVDSRGRETLIAGWKTMVKRFVGRPWELEIAVGDGPLATNDLDAILPETLIPEAKGFDKLWLFRVEPSADGVVIAGREFDSATAQIGLVCRRPAQVLADGPRALLQLSLDVFAASSEIADAPEPKKRKIRVQGASIPAATPIGQVVSIGSVFRPSRIFYKPEGGIQRLDIINSTYLLVEKIEGGVATCRLISGLGNPLTEKVVGKAKMVAVGLKPASIPTKIRFTFANLEGTGAAGGVKAEERPAAGYTVVARPAPDGSPREVGTTDREGRITLAPGFADGLVILRLMAAGTEPLLEFPVMPGEMLGEKWMKGIDPRGRAVTAESDLYALRDEIIDLIGARSRLEYKLRARAKAEKPNLEDMKVLMEEFKALSPKDAIARRHAKIDEDLSAWAKEFPREQVRTKSAVALLKDVGVMIDRYLDDDPFKEIEIFYSESMAAAAAGKNQAKALPKMVIGPKPAGPPGVAGTPTTFTPPGGGFSILMPGNPNEATSKTPDNAAEVKTYKIAVPGKGVFSASFWDYPVAITSADTMKVLDTERDRLKASIPGAKITREVPTLVAGLEGKEVEFEGPPGRSGEVPTMVARIGLNNSRVIAVSVGGSKAHITAAPANEFLNSLKLEGKGGKAIAGAVAPPAQPKANADPRTSTAAGAAGAIDKAKKAAEKSGGGGSSSN